jgi:hypothetical protein
MNSSNLDRFSVNLKDQKILNSQSAENDIIVEDIDIGDRVCLKGTGQIVTIQKLNVQISDNITYDYAGNEEPNGPLYFFNKKNILKLVQKVSKEGGKIK